jgi:hypothetical protein
VERRGEKYRSRGEGRIKKRRDNEGESHLLSSLSFIPFTPTLYTWGTYSISRSHSIGTGK